MKLTHYYGQYKKVIGKVMESEFHITVDYDPKNDSIGNIESVKAYNNEKKVFTDLTAIFCENLPKQLDEIIEDVDWRELYREAVETKTEMIDE